MHGDFLTEGNESLTENWWLLSISFIPRDKSPSSPQWSVGNFDRSNAKTLLTYDQYKQNRLVCRAHAYCKSVYNDLGSYDLYEGTKKLWDKLLYSVIAPIIRQTYLAIGLIKDENQVLPLIVKFDTCYTQRGHHSLDGHSTMKEAITGLIVGFKCQHRDSPSGHRTGDLQEFFDEASGTL